MKRLFRTPFLVLLASSMVTAAFLGASVEDDASLLKQARQAMARGAPDEAVRLLGGLSGDPSSSRTTLDARRLLVEALIRRGEGEQAAAEARRLFQSLPRGHAARRGVRFLLADALLEAGKEEERARILQEEAAAVLADPHLSSVASHYLKLARNAERTAPSAGEAAGRRRSALIRAVRLYRKALEVLTGGRPHAPISIPIIRDLLEAKRARQALKEARGLLEERLAPAQEAEARYLLARCWRDVGERDRALGALNGLLAVPNVEESPFAAKGLRLKAEILVSGTSRPEDFDQGIAAYDLFLKRHPDHPEASAVRRAVADAFFDRRDLERALQRYEAVVADEGAPRNQRARALFRIARCKEILLPWREARGAWRHFIERFPDDRHVPEAQARLRSLLIEESRKLVKQERFAEAIQVLELFLKEYPVDASAPHASVEIGLILRRMKRFEEAVKVLAAARDRFRGHDDGEAGRAGFLLGLVQEEDLRDPEAAIASYREVVKSFPRSRHAREARLRLELFELVQMDLTSPRIFTPGEDVRLPLSVRNIGKVTCRVYRLDAAAAFDQRGSLSAAADIEVALVKADRTFTHQIPDYRSHLLLRTSLPVEAAPGSGLPEGAWLVSVEARQRRAVVPVIVSSIRMVVKSSPHEVFAWVVDARTGEPRPGVRVLVRGEGISAELETDAEGVARLVYEEPQSEPVRVLAVSGASVAPGMTPDRVKRAGRQRLAPALAFTLDRPLYRPGDEIRFQAILRRVEGGIFVTPSGEECLVRLRNPQGRVIDETTCRTGDFGTLHGSLHLPPEGAPGTYRIETAFAGSVFTEDVVVKAFQTPEYRVIVKPRRRVSRPGEPVEVDVRVESWFGGVVPGARVDWVVFKRPLSIDSSRYREYAWYLRAIDRKRSDRRPEDQRHVAGGTLLTDESGRGSFTFTTGLEAGMWRHLIRVSALDSVGGAVVGGATVAAGPVDRFAVVLADRRAYQVGDKAAVRVITADLTHEAVATTGTLAALIRREEASGEAWEEVRRVTVDTGLSGEARLSIELPEDGRYKLRFEGRDAAGKPVVAETSVEALGRRPDPESDARLRFERKVCLGGSKARMHLSLPFHDRPVLITFEGERVLRHLILRPRRNFQVHEVLIPEDLAPNVTVAVAAPFGRRLLTSRDEIVVLRYLKVAISPERSEARPGEAVKIHIATTNQLGRPVPASVALRVSDDALSALGGGAGADPRFVFNRNRRPHLVSTTSSHAFAHEAVSRPLDADLVNLAREHELRVRLSESRKRMETMAEEAFEEEDVDKDADDVLLDNKDVLGEKKETAGKMSAVAGGGAVVSYGGPVGPSGGRRPAPSPMDARLPQLSWKSTRQGENDGLRKFNLLKQTKNQGVRLGARVGPVFESSSALRGLPLVKPELREHFEDTAAFWPNVITDGEGRAERTLRLPDNLTVWRLRGVGVDRGVSVGAGETTLRVSREVTARPDRPAFLVSGDEVNLRVQIRSHLERAAPFRLQVRSLDPDVIEVVGMEAHDLEVAPSGRAIRPFQLAVGGAGVAKLDVSASSPLASDALRVGIPVLPFGEEWSLVQRGRSGAGRPFQVHVEVPAGAVPGSERSFVVVRSGVAAEILEGVAFLAAYPHACLEQTVNRFLPAMLLASALRERGAPLPLDMAGLRRRVEAGCRSLSAFQTKSGAFGYWPASGKEHPWATALALEALARASRLGYRVPPALLDAARAGARKLLRAKGVDPNARAALLFALVVSGAKDPETLNVLFRRRSALTQGARARLLLAAARSGAGALVERIARELDPRAVLSEAGQRPARLVSCWEDSGLARAALVLMALHETRAPSSALEALVQRVRKGLRRREGGTAAVALAIQALARTAAREAGLLATGKVRVIVDDAPVAEGEVTAEMPLLVLPLGPGKPGPGSHTIRVESESVAPLACRVILGHMRPVERVRPSGNVLEVRRRVVPYRNPSQKRGSFKRGYAIVKESSRPPLEPPPSLGETEVGKRVTVELEVTAREDTSYLVIEEPLLAGLDVIEEGVRGSHDRLERHRAKLVFFKDSLRKGETLRITYPCYAVRGGRYRALPAAAREMYAPERRGSSSSLAFRIVTDPGLLARKAPVEPTPDEIHAAALDAFAGGEWAVAAEHLRKLLDTFDLREDVRDDLLGRLTLASLRMERWDAAIKAFEELELRNPGKLRLRGGDLERMGRAYLETGAPRRAAVFFEGVVEAALDLERRVRDAYLAEGQALACYLLDKRSLVAWPASMVAAFRLSVAEEALQVPDPRLKSLDPGLPALQRSRWREALDLCLATMAWSTGTPLCEEAGLRRIRILHELGLDEALVKECRFFREVLPKSSYMDEVLFREAEALFRLGRHAECSRTARRVWEWRRPRDGKPSEEVSLHRMQAGYLLGKIAHLNGDYAEAVKWYGRVRDDVDDARESWLFFTEKTLWVESLVRLTGREDCVLPCRVKNVDSLEARLYPVDLLVLFAVKKSFDRLDPSELSGIRPARTLKVPVETPPFTESVARVRWGRLDPGAYVVLLSAGDKAVGTLLLVGESRLDVQRTDDRVRVWLVDGRGRPVPGAQVSLASEGRVFHTGRTDERGILVTEAPDEGEIHVVAVKGNQVAVASDRGP